MPSVYDTMGTNITHISYYLSIFIHIVSIIIHALMKYYVTYICISGISIGLCVFKCRCLQYVYTLLEMLIPLHVHLLEHLVMEFHSCNTPPLCVYTYRQCERNVSAPRLHITMH